MLTFAAFRSPGRTHLYTEHVMRRIGLSRRAIYTLVVVAGLLVLTASYAWYRSRTAPEVYTVAISDLVNRAEKGEIQRAIISGPVVTAIDRSGTRLRAL